MTRICDERPVECGDPACPCHEWSARSPSESLEMENQPAGFLAPEPKNASEGKYGAGMTICRDCQGTGAGDGPAGTCVYCHATGQVETYEARQWRLTTLAAPDFDHEWREAPRSMRDYVEREVAEKWLMRGVWLGIRYERERGLLAINGDLREMQRIARERINVTT